MNYLLTALAVGLVTFVATRAATDREWNAATGRNATRNHPFANLTFEVAEAPKEKESLGAQDV